MPGLCLKAKGPGLGLEICTDNFGISFKCKKDNKINNGLNHKLIINEYLSKKQSNLVHYLYCQLSDVLHILISSMAVCLKALALRPMALAFKG